MFHVSQLRKFVSSFDLVLDVVDGQVREDLSWDTKLVWILDVQSKQLRGKSIHIVKVLWNGKTQELTYRLEEEMKESYSPLVR